MLKNQLAAVAYGAMASRSLAPTPPPVKLPAPPTAPREPGSQQGVRAARVQQSTMIANDIYEDFKKGFVPLRGIGSAEESCREEGPAPKKAQQLRKKSLDGRPVRSEVEELGATLEIGWRCITSQDKVARATALTGEIQDAQGRMGPIAGS